MGTVVVFEGIDGSGKSNTIRSLQQKLVSSGKSSIVLPAPTKEFTGICCRESIIKNCNVRTVFYLMIADRIIHNEQISSCKKDYDYVLVDRYFLSTLAYQNVLTEYPFYFDIVINTALPVNKLIYLDVDVKEARSRIEKRGTAVVDFESLENLRIIKNNYRQLLERNNVEDYLTKREYAIHNLIINQVVEIDTNNKTIDQISTEVFDKI